LYEVRSKDRNEYIKKEKNEKGGKKSKRQKARRMKEEK
jgi:hypothetical protein